MMSNKVIDKSRIFSNINNKVNLNWTTVTETNNSGFEIQRMLQEGEYNAIAFIPGYGTTTEKHNYIYYI